MVIEQPPLTNLRWRGSDAILGIFAAIPPLLLFCGMLNSRRFLSQTRDFLERAVRPWFGRWSILQLALISALAGLCEEALFRG